MTDAQDKPLLVVRRPTTPNPYLPAEYLEELRRRARDEDTWRREYMGEWPEVNDDSR